MERNKPKRLVNDYLLFMEEYFSKDLSLEEDKLSVSSKEFESLGDYDLKIYYEEENEE
jgi:hypothetical protein